MNSDRNAPIVCNVFKQWRQLTHLSRMEFLTEINIPFPF